MQQHIESESDHQNLLYFTQYSWFGFSKLKRFKNHMQSELGLPVFDHQHTSLSGPSISATQVSSIDNLPALIENHENESVESFANSMMTPLYANGHSNELFL